MKDGKIPKEALPKLSSDEGYVMQEQHGHHVAVHHHLQNPRESSASVYPFFSNTRLLHLHYRIISHLASLDMVLLSFLKYFIGGCGSKHPKILNFIVHSPCKATHVIGQVELSYRSSHNWLSKASSHFSFLYKTGFCFPIYSNCSSFQFHRCGPYARRLGSRLSLEELGIPRLIKLYPCHVIRIMK
ncbi:uncharacterized protein LOC130783138 [Actinidia eriantha]|uniref:uncharacterized protein LOC130783138 n=1 Tax=Actinidia eriantha TaxID=165200 RepID=UPI0025895739|nr:uncharacterized protein LOC130783138 [Actinidia eriantha]